jgi:histidinol-phosphate phosphatase family protein
VSEHSGAPALFIDRDGTIIADAHYLSDASRVALLPTAVEAVRAANAAGVPVVIVTNQSGIARGLITEAQYAATRDRTVALLAAQGAQVLATYHCPHWPEVSGPCDCRKPALGMYRDAARDHGVALSRSAFIGDRWRDVQPALAVGGLGVFVTGVESPAKDVEQARTHAGRGVIIGAHLLDAVHHALAWIARNGAAPIENRATRQG